MEGRTVPRPRHIHKREASGSNETTILGGLHKESSSISKSDTTVSTSQGLPSSSSIISSTATSSIPAVPVRLPRTTINTENAPSTTTEIHSPASDKALSTSVVPSSSSPSSSASSSLATITTSTISTTTTSLSSSSSSITIPAPIPIASETLSPAKQLLATPSAPSAPVVPAPAAAFVSSSTTSSAEATPTTIIVDTSERNAPSTSIPAPSFAPLSTSQPSTADAIQTNSALADLSAASGPPTNANALQEPSSTFVSSSMNPIATGAIANGQQSNQPTNSTIPSTSQGINTPTIVGAAIGSIAAFIFLAILGIWCIRRRYKKKIVFIPPYKKKSGAGERLPISQPPMTEHFRPDVKTLFHSRRLSAISEQASRSSTPTSLPPPYRHSRAYTTTVLPPAIPARSAARPSVGPFSIAAGLSNVLAPPQPEPTVSIDASFMGTISTYFSSSSNNSSKSNSIVPPIPHSRNISTSESRYTPSPYTSYIAPDTQNNNNNSGSISPAEPDSASIPIQTEPNSAFPFPTPSKRDSGTLGGGLGTSRFQSMGQWRDSMWSTSATPISNSNDSSGTPSAYFPRPASHRASRSLGDVLDWRSDRSGSASTGSSESSAPPPPLPLPEVRALFPSRSPVQAWPLN